ncbi:putative cyclin-D2-3 [Phragmites australis]|uniref:putative cyclin-D2-3 n=1 Tax=Phragmites australis TaxID=29695 RepID=UPI002D7A30F9|nr:putative cyclin-D2-3 [Phragmites australis]
MGFFCIGSSSFSLLCEEDRDSILGCADGEGEAPELGRDLDSSCFVGLPLESDELVGSLMEKEKEQLIGIATGDYLERLNNGGLEFSWRTAAIDWIGKAKAHHNFGPLCVYLAVNYLDRFLSSKQAPVDMPWMQQLLPVACLSIAAKMEETMVTRSLELQVCNAKYVFEAKTVKTTEILVLSSLNWRMKAVTPFSYINYFLDKFNGGKPLTSDVVSRCTELILGTLTATKFLQFRPSEIATAVVLSTVAETQVLDFSTALAASKIPVDKENVRRCHEAMQEMALVKNTNISVSPSVSKSPSGVLDSSCFSYKTDDNRTTMSSQENNYNANNNQACTPANKRTKLDSEPMP